MIWPDQRPPLREAYLAEACPAESTYKGNYPEYYECDSNRRTLDLDPTLSQSCCRSLQTKFVYKTKLNLLKWWVPARGNHMLGGVECHYHTFFNPWSLHGTRILSGENREARDAERTPGPTAYSKICGTPLGNLELKILHSILAMAPSMTPFGRHELPIDTALPFHPS